MRKFLGVFLLLVLCAMASAQITDAEKTLRAKPVTDTINGWKTGGIVTMNLSQTSLKNWSAGGNNSIAGTGLISLFANHKSTKSSWDNNFDIGYGRLVQNDQNNGRQSVKTDDRIDFNAKYGRQIVPNVFYAGFLSFKTQMAKGYAKPTDSIYISNFLSPAYIILAAGIDTKPAKDLGVFAAPLTGRVTIVKDTSLSNKGAFGVPKGSHERYEFGGYVRVTYKIDLMQNVTLQAKADFFSNYLKHPLDIVTNSEFLLSMKVNKYIGATLGGTIIYDHAVRLPAPTASDPKRTLTKVQFKELLGIGFSYKFKS